MFHKRKTHQGFTLIELMVVILLMSIILAVALPRFGTGIAHDPVKKASRWLFHTVRTLRSSAVQQQKIHILVIDLSRNRMWMMNESMDEAAQMEAPDKGFKLPEDLQLVDVLFANRDSVSSGTAEIFFHPSGYSDKAAIRLQDDDANRFTYLFEPLLPKVKFFEEWLSF